GAVPRLRRPGWTLRHRGDPSDSSLRLELGYAFPGCGAPGEFISAAGPAPERGCSPRGQALAGVACRRRQKKYESPQSTPVAAAQPHASGPSPTERWAMSAEPRLMATLSTFGAELLCVLGVQSLPAAELHGLGADDASQGLTPEQPFQHIEADVPSGSTHRDEAAIDVGPQRQARAAAKRFELPPDIEATPVVLERPGSVGPRHCCFGNMGRGRSHGGELHPGSRGTQVPIGVERRPFGQLRWIGQRLPDHGRRMTELSDENERPFLSILLNLHS